MVVAVFLLLTACGFHLRGLGSSTLLITELSVTVVGDPTSSAVHAFQNSLSDNDIMIVDQKLSPWHVVLSDFRNARNVLAVGGVDGNVRNVSLNDGYRVEVFYNGKSIGSLYISNNTSVQYSSAQFIGDSEEEERAHLQLARENAAAALRYINSRVLQMEQKSPNTQ